MSQIYMPPRPVSGTVLVYLGVEKYYQTTTFEGTADKVISQGHLLSED
jgi:hypothetical protein